MIVILSSLILIISYNLFRMAAGTLSIVRPNLISIIFIKDLLLYSVVGVMAVVLSFDLTQDWYFWGITSNISDESRFAGWLSTMYTIIAMPFTMLLVNYLSVKRLTVNSYILHYYNSPLLIIKKDNQQIIFYLLWVLLFVCIVSILYTFIVIGDVPLFHLFGDVAAEYLEQVRADSKINFAGVVFVREYLAINLTMLTSMICYSYYLFNSKLKYRILFYTSFSLAFAILTYNLEKSPFIWYLISLMFINIVVSHGASLRTIIYNALLVSIAVIFIFALLHKDDGNGYYFDLVYRIFVAQSVAIFMGFEYFPSVHEFLGFEGVSKLFTIFTNAEVKNSGRILFEIYAPSAVENNTAGYIVGLFNAEAWMLFGMIGVLTMPILVGFIIQMLNLFFIKSPKTPINVGLYVYFWTKLSVSGSLTQFIYPTTIIFPILVVVFVVYVARIRFAIEKKL